MRLIMCEHDMTCHCGRTEREKRIHKHMHLSFPVTFRLWSSTFLWMGRKCLTASVSLTVRTRETPCTLTSFVLPDIFMKRSCRWWGQLSLKINNKPNWIKINEWIQSSLLSCRHTKHILLDLFLSFTIHMDFFLLCILFKNLSNVIFNLLEKHNY